MNKNSYIDLENSNSKPEENIESENLNKIKLKMEKMLKTYFKNEPSVLIYFIIEAEKKIEKIDFDSIIINKINLEIKSWKKYFTKNILIQISLEVLKSNNIQIKNLNSILNEFNYNNNINNNENYNKEKEQLNSTDINMDKINEINSTSELSENDDESLIFNNNTLSLENILKINVNKDKEINRKIKIGDRDEEQESSCNAEYFESINFLPLDEFKDIEMQINNSKNKENNNTNNINSDDNLTCNKKNCENDKNLRALDFLKRKTKNHLSDSFHYKLDEKNYFNEEK